MGVIALKCCPQGASVLQDRLGGALSWTPVTSQNHCSSQGAGGFLQLTAAGSQLLFNSRYHFCNQPCRPPKTMSFNYLKELYTLRKLRGKIAYFQNSIQVPKSCHLIYGVYAPHGGFPNSILHLYYTSSCPVHMHRPHKGGHWIERSTKLHIIPGLIPRCECFKVLIQFGLFLGVEMTYQ